MSGHSHWSTIRRKKDVADARRGHLFTKLAREIVIAAREGGGDPESNLRLQYAIEKARASNMPKDNIDRAVKRGTGELKDAAEIEEIFYEGYAPHAIAFMIACQTDNRNRTVAELRHVLTKAGGSLGEAGSVAWQFKRISYFAFPLNNQDPDKIFEMAVEFGANDVAFEEDYVEIFAEVSMFKEISDQLKAHHITPETAELRLIPKNETELGDNETIQILRLVEMLEDLDDVQNVFSNLAISDSLMAELAEA